MTRQVIHGSVRAVRTFHLLPDGGLAPVSGHGNLRDPWPAGVNTAECLPRISLRRRDAAAAEHEPPAPGCSCGLWAFGSLQALRQAPLRDQRRVIAVIRCHGTVIPGARGVRAQHAAIEAIWLAADVTDRQLSAVARRYPGAAIYRSLSAMLAEHPLTQLSSYRLPEPENRAIRPRQTLLALTVTWWVAMVAWVDGDARIALPASSPPLASVATAAVAAPWVIVLAAILAAWWRRKCWPAVLGLAAQTALVAVAYWGLPYWLAVLGVHLSVLLAGVLHLLLAVNIVWSAARRYDADGNLTPWFRRASQVLGLLDPLRLVIPAESPVGQFGRIDPGGSRSPREPA